ncbi:MAG: ABC transporter permease subunit [Deltaproteobacteria bacterium]|nr:ABC transporter permease subunit [Deltaproteobacteria bacterium]
MKGLPEKILRWIFIATVLTTIEVLVRFNLVDRIFLTSPSLIAAAAWQSLFAGDLISLSLKTVSAVGMAFVIAAGIGLSAGYVLWRYPLFGRAYDELLGALFASPLILLYPISLVILGRGINAIIAMAFLPGMIPIALNTHQGLRDVNPTYLKAGRGMRLTERQIMRHVLLPAASPLIFGGLKLGLTYILISVIALEFLVEIGGIGTLASKGYFWFNTEELYVGVAGAIFLSIIFVYLLGKAESRLFSS